MRIKERNNLKTKKSAKLQQKPISIEEIFPKELTNNENKNKLNQFLKNKKKVDKNDLKNKINK